MGTFLLLVALVMIVIFIYIEFSAGVLIAIGVHLFAI